MKEKLNYPIKWAVQELKITGGSSIGYEKVTLGYIVSKCYVIKNIVEYDNNGDIAISHEVVFPYNNFSKFDNDKNNRDEYFEEQIIPHITFHGVVNIDTVTDLFDTYEAAKELCDEKNDEYRINKLATQYWDYTAADFAKKFEKEENRILSQIAICKRYEDYIIKNTGNLAVSNTPIINEKFFEQMPTKKGSCFDTALKGSKVYLKEIGKKKK